MEQKNASYLKSFANIHDDRVFFRVGSRFHDERSDDHARGDGPKMLRKKKGRERERGNNQAKENGRGRGTVTATNAQCDNPSREEKERNAICRQRDQLFS